ncbi:MAG: major capsid protein [Microvirus sp.]|nr:MAG: major capsid protein [Microvirus sp.]
MKPLFNQVKINRPKTNAFDLSQEKKLSLNMGELVPIMVQEILPGDRFKVTSEMLVRFAPMLAPMMHRVNAYTHFFFVPNRLVYDEWQNYITGGADGTLSPAFPTISVQEALKAQFTSGKLPDYMGIPSVDSGTVIQNLNINALPFRAYQLIYNEYYRDQTLTTAVPITKNTTVTVGEQAELTTLRKRSWEKDYFTSSLPWTQRGSDVNLPTTLQYKNPPLATFTATPGGAETIKVSAGTQTTSLMGSGTGGVITKLDNLTSVDITVNNLRRALKLQEWLERNALGGSRYIEQILSHFGVKSSDARLQRPEFLGGGKTPVVVSEVVSTVKEATNPQGNMAGHGIAVGRNNGFSKYFEEHGYVIGIMSVMPRTAYQQGLPRMYSKADRYDFYWPEFANLGEQAILKKELYYDITNAVNDNTFGYTPRYAEYKFNNSSVHGDFRTTLNFWHMGRIFAANPSLNATFVESDPTNRVFAVVDSSDKLYVQLYNDIKAIRPMPVFGTPML